MSTDKSLVNKKMLDRLLDALLAKGLKKHGMGRQITEKTGYSSGQVSNLLKGKDNLNDRFIKSICQAFGISEGWLRTGEGEMFASEGGHSIPYLDAEAAQYRSASTVGVDISARGKQIVEMFGFLEGADPEIAQRVYEEVVEAYIVTMRRRQQG